jgi:hypothetical protein
MQPSLHALLSSIVDYAGLFPPAKLPLEDSIRNYARYRQEPDRWMLGRFIIPAARLTELAPFADLFNHEPPFLFSALGRGGDTMRAFLTGLRSDLEAITQFHQQHEGKATVDVLEVKLPADVLGPKGADAVKQLFLQTALMLDQHAPAKLTPYYEPSLSGDWRALLNHFPPALATANASTATTRVINPSAPPPPESGHQGGFKLRCGGLEAAAFPSIEQVAAVITACHEHRIPLKATAGLHHPLRRFDASVQTHMHGFLNVFGAAVLAHTRPWCEELGQIILSEEDPSAFRFDADSFQWRDLRVSVADIQAARRRAAISFGSCSFDEPRDDLRTLGFIA